MRTHPGVVMQEQLQTLHGRGTAGHEFFAIKAVRIYDLIIGCAGAGLGRTPEQVGSSLGAAWAARSARAPTSCAAGLQLSVCSCPRTRTLLGCQGRELVLHADTAPVAPQNGRCRDLRCPRAYIAPRVQEKFAVIERP